jgi:predicted Zn-dependent peptidase
MDNICFLYNNNKKFNIYIYASCGSIYENSKNSGISHVLEHMVLKHTKEYSENKLLDELTIIGGEYNAVTERDVTYYYCWSHIDNYKKVLDIMSSVSLNPVFKQNEFDIEKNVVIQEISSDIEQRIINNLSVYTILDKTNAYSYPIEGNVKTINNISIKDLTNYYNKNYKDVLIVVNCDKRYETEVKEYTYKLFGKSKKINFDKLSNVYNLNASKLASKIIVISEDSGSFTTFINFISFPQSMLRENTIINFIRYCLVSCGLKSILLYELRSKRGLVYSVSSINDIYRYIGILRFNITITNKNIMRILGVVFDVINKLKTHGLTPELFNYYKKSYLNHKKYDFTSDSYKTYWYGKNKFYGIEANYQDVIDIIKSITNQDIIDISNKVFNFKQIGILTNGNYGKGITIKNNIQNLLNSYI